MSSQGVRKWTELALIVTRFSIIDFQIRAGSMLPTLLEIRDCSETQIVRNEKSQTTNQTLTLLFKKASN